MLYLPKLYISAILLLATLFWGAKGIIEWYYQNWSYLYKNIPSDINIEAVENIVSSMCCYIFISDDERAAQILCVKARVVERGFARDARCAKPQNI